MAIILSARYDRTFTFIVKLINDAIAVETSAGDGKKNTVIGVLDIYGFEVR